MMNRHLDLDALRAFAAIVDSGGFSSAATQLGRTQSAVSLQIKRLEQSLGQTLLQRVQGRVDGPTAEGAALLAYARQLLRLNDEACAALRQNSAVGSLRIGLPEELMESVFPAVMPGFRALYPRLRLFVQADTSAALRRVLADGALDVAIVKHCGDELPADSELIHSEPLCWMAGLAYRDAPPEAEAVLPLALFGENCVFRLAVGAALAGAGLASVLQYTGSSTTGLRHAVRHGLGITALPRSLLDDGLVTIERYGALNLPALPPARLLALHAPGEVAAASRCLLGLLGAAIKGR
jgi:DNA-binding transcriptional LysR family regulator